MCPARVQCVLRVPSSFRTIFLPSHILAGNVRSVVNWTADAEPRLFPHGLPAFADNLGLTLQLYTPFWADAYESPFNMTESTVFKGTKLVVPEQSYAFFANYFDFGIAQTNGRFQIFEIDCE